MAIIRLVFVCLLWLSGVISAHAEVSISGTDKLVRTNILAYLMLDDEPCDAPDWRVRRLFTDADTEIRESLEVIGYYNVEIEKKLDTSTACWQANFVITAGQPVLLRTISIKVETGIAQDIELDNAVQKCALHSGGCSATRQL